MTIGLFNSGGIGLRHYIFSRQSLLKRPERYMYLACKVSILNTGGLIALNRVSLNNETVQM